MLTKIALAAALIAGTATVAFAEDSSSSFSLNTYAGPQYSAPAMQYSAPGFTNRNVSLGGGQAVRGAQGAAQDWFSADVQDRASSPYAGGGF